MNLKQFFRRDITTILFIGLLMYNIIVLGFYSYVIGVYSPKLLFTILFVSLVSATPLTALSLLLYYLGKEGTRKNEAKKSR